MTSALRTTIQRSLLESAAPGVNLPDTFACKDPAAVVLEDGDGVKRCTSVGGGAVGTEADSDREPRHGGPTEAEGTATAPTDRVIWPQ